MKRGRVDLGVGWGEGVAELSGLTFEIFEEALLIALFVVVDAWVREFALKFEHSVDDTGEFVSGSGDSFGCAEGSAFTAVEGAEGGIGMSEGKGGHTESGIGPVFGLFGAAFDDLATGFIVVGAQAEPGSEVFDGFPR